MLVARRIDAIRITNERYEREIREQEMGKLATEAELRALRAQINPHFLFNALTTIGYLIQTAPPRALETLMRLTSLLRARAALRRRIHDARPRARGGRGVPRHRARAIRAAAARHASTCRRRSRRFACRRSCCSRSSRTPSSTASRRSARRRRHGQRAGRSVATGAAQLVAASSRTPAPARPRTTCSRGREPGVGLRNVERRLACQYGDAASLVDPTAPGRGHDRRNPAAGRAQGRDRRDVCRERRGERAPPSRRRRRRAAGPRRFWSRCCGRSTTWSSSARRRRAGKRSR